MKLLYKGECNVLIYLFLHGHTFLFKEIISLNFEETWIIFLCLEAYMPPHSSLCSPEPQVCIPPLIYCSSGGPIKSKLFINGPWTNTIKMYSCPYSGSTRNISNDFSFWAEMCFRCISASSSFHFLEQVQMNTITNHRASKTGNSHFFSEVFLMWLHPCWSVILLWFSWRGSEVWKVISALTAIWLVVKWPGFTV